MGSTSVQVKSILRSLHQLIIHGNSYNEKRVSRSSKETFFSLGRGGSALAFFFFLFFLSREVTLIFTFTLTEFWFLLIMVWFLSLFSLSSFYLSSSSSSTFSISFSISVACYSAISLSVTPDSLAWNPSWSFSSLSKSSSSYSTDAFFSSSGLM